MIDDVEARLALEPIDRRHVAQEIELESRLVAKCVQYFVRMLAPDGDCFLAVRTFRTEDLRAETFLQFFYEHRRS